LTTAAGQFLGAKVVISPIHDDARLRANSAIHGEGIADGVIRKIPRGRATRLLLESAYVLYAHFVVSLRIDEFVTFSEDRSRLLDKLTRFRYFLYRRGVEGGARMMNVDGGIRRFVGIFRIAI
jgi:hypothetical protein